MAQSQFSKICDLVVTISFVLGVAATNRLELVQTDSKRQVAIFLLVLSGCCDKFLLFTRAIFVATTSCD